MSQHVSECPSVGGRSDIASYGQTTFVYPSAITGPWAAPHSSCGEGCYEHRCTSVSSTPRFRFLWAHTQTWVAGSYGNGTSNALRDHFAGFHGSSSSLLSATTSPTLVLRKVPGSGPSDGCGGASACSSDLRLPGDR